MTTDLTSLLTTIEAAVGAATPGPWRMSELDDDGSRCFVQMTTSPWAVIATCAFGPYEGSRDADLIAHAPEWLTALVAEVRRLVADKEALEGALRRFTDPEKVAGQFHAIYEIFAPDYGYETRKESAVPWSKVPERNRSLMIAVAEEVIASKARALLGPDDSGKGAR